jgi:hypothetical protein
MDYDLIRQWDAWLRDPSNRQTSGTLRRTDDEGDSFCCLGGLCVLAGVEWRRGRWGASDKWIDDPLYSWLAGDFTNGALTEAGVLPHSLARRLGVDSNPLLAVPERLYAEKIAGNEGIHYYNKPGTPIPAARLNDDYRFTFVDIADCVRATWPEAFA